MENIVGMVASPSETIKKVLSEKPLGLGFFIVGASLIINQILSATLPTPTLRSTTETIAQPLIKLSQIPVNTLASLIFLAIFLGLVYGIARLLGGKGSFKETFLAFSFGNVPSLFSALLVLVILTPSLLHLSKVPTLVINTLVFGIYLGLMFWVTILVIMGLKIAHDFSYVRAAVSLLALPVVLLLLLFSLLIVLAVLYSQVMPPR